MLIREFVQAHPEVCTDRPELTFTRHCRTDRAADALAASGVVLLRDVIPPRLVRRCRRMFHRAARSLAKRPATEAACRRQFSSASSQTNRLRFPGPPRPGAVGPRMLVDALWISVCTREDRPSFHGRLPDWAVGAGSPDWSPKA